MAAALIDDVFDVLEGTLAEVIRTRRLVENHERASLQIRIREARAAVAMLTALMREGRVWRPAVDGSEAIDWRSTLLATCEEVGAPASYVTLLRRELDELVALAPAGGRRPLPSGLFERLARRAGVRRDACITWARTAGDDLLAGWRACDDARSVVRIALELGVAPVEIGRAATRALRVAAPEAALDSRGNVTALQAEWACERAQQAGLFRELVTQLDTPQLRDRLVDEGAN